MSGFLSIEESIEIFEMNIHNENLSESTIVEYLKELSYFAKHLADRGVQYLNEIRQIDIELYFSKLVKKGNSANTRNRTRSALNSYFRGLVRRGAIESNPVDIIGTIKIKEAEMKENPPLTQKELVKLKKSVIKGSRMPEKNIAIIDLMGVFGLRVGELVQLKWEDLNELDKSLRVRGKGGKIRYVPVFDDVYENLKKLRKKQPKNCEYIINYKNENRPVSTRSIFDTVVRYSKKAKLKDTVGCHTLRATSATNFMIAGVSVKYIQMLLGHSDIKTTSKYMRPLDEEMVNALKTAHKANIA